VSALRWLADNPALVAVRLAEHAALSAVAVAVALAIALPLGIALVRAPRLATWVQGGLGIAYAIPSLALFVLLVPWLGLGADTALVALVLYAQTSLVRAVVAGLREVPAPVLEAADGMGMSPGQRLLAVELPLAAPIVASGARVATVTAIGIGTVAALVKAGGLGELLFEGVRTYHHGKIAAGALAAALLALAANVALGRVERAMRRWAGA